jgi:regulator of protease activity HflC (stomatin/prohibitin superfamily)
MAAEQTAQAPIPDETQLTQERVPLDQAADAFARRDGSGRIPIVVLPERASRFSPQLLLAAATALGVGLGIGLWQDNFWLIVGGIAVAALLVVLGVQRSFRVTVPEGTSALLASRGRYERTLPPGLHIVPPYIAVTHLVTRREIPFDVPVTEAPTQDNVRATVDSLVTFSITEPHRFVYNISADDFDQVFQAVCQEALRAMVRRIPSDQVADLAGQDKTELRTAIGAGVAAYGVEIRAATITYAQPPAEFIRTQEARQLAVLQRAEQAERQALAQRRQADDDALARQRVLAQVAREQEEFMAQAQRAEARRHVVEAEAAVEELRLAKLEDRLHRFPNASRWEWEGERLGVARSLAGNTRAVLQVGTADDIVNALVVRDVLQEVTSGNVARGDLAGGVGGGPHPALAEREQAMPVPDGDSGDRRVA